MRTRSRGRGTAGAFGFLLLAAGLIGAGVLLFLSYQRPASSVEAFARAGVGCTTTLDFKEPGTFFVYEESSDEVFEPTDGCQPTPTVGQPFDFTLSGPATVTPSIDRTVSYDLAGFVGNSVARFEVTEPGLYEIEVRGEDVRSVAAVGRDPDTDVDQLRRAALAVGAAGVLLGLLLLVLAGRRSKLAATPSVPDGPGWRGRTEADLEREWPPQPPSVPRAAINPHQPDLPAYATPPPPPLPAREPGAAAAVRSPWDAPAADERPVSSEAPMPPPPPRAPLPTPVLPDAPGAVSGRWPPTPPPPLPR